MANYAVVIGVNQYQKIDPLLSPVGDAMEMASWLLDRGGVPADNLILLLSPVPPAPSWPGVTMDAAESKPILKAIYNVDKWSRQPGNGLYFFFAGHGIANRVPLLPDEDGMVPADFELGFTSPISVQGVQRYFQACQFKQQVFVLDCCRNYLPRDATGAPVTVNMERPLDKTRPEGWTVDQFVFNATAPGLRAVDEADGRGLMAAAIVGGLKGAGRAKVWEPDARNGQGAYVVRPERLLKHVQACFKGRPTVVPSAGTTPIYQEPQMGGSHNSDPSLAEYDRNEVPPIRLSVELSPDSVIPTAWVEVTGDDFYTPRTQLTKADVPVTFDMPPMFYTLRAWAPGYKPPRTAWQLDLYDPTKTVEIPFQPHPAESLAGGHTGGGAIAGGVPGYPVGTGIGAVFGAVVGGLAGGGGGALAGTFVDDFDPGDHLKGGGAANVGTTGSLDGGGGSGTLAGAILGEFHSGDPMGGGGAVVGAATGGSDIGGRPFDSGGPRFVMTAKTASDLFTAAESMGPGTPAGAVAGGAQVPAHVVLRYPDRMALLALVDASGQPVTDTNGRPLIQFTQDLVCDVGKPGYYRARLVLPEGGSMEELIRLLPGSNPQVTLDAPETPPAGLVRYLSEAVGFVKRNESGSVLDLAEYLPQVTTPAVSTILALAGDATDREDRLRGAGKRLRKIGLTPFAPGIRSGFRLVAAIDFDDDPDATRAGREGFTRVQARALLEGLRLRLSPLDGPPGDRVRPGRANWEGIAQFSRPLEPGPYWLSVQTPSGLEGDPAARAIEGDFAVTVLDGRVTELILHREVSGRVRVAQFMPSLDPQEQLDPDAIRRLDLLQRFVLDGRLGEATTVALDLLAHGPADPVAGCLGGYLLMRDPRPDATADVAPVMRARFPGLSDSHVLLGHYFTAMFDQDGGRGSAAATHWRDEAVASFRRALDLGLPILAPFLDRLRDGVRRFRIDHRRAGLVARVAGDRIPDSLWTAWVPPPVDEGALVFEAFGPPPFAELASLSSPPEGAFLMSDLSPQKVTDVVPNEATAGLCTNLSFGGPYYPDDPTTAQPLTKAAFDESRIWDNGMTLKVAILNAQSSAWTQRVSQAVMQIAPTWSHYANLALQFVNDGVAHVSINLLPHPLYGNYGTYNCFVGTDCLKYIGTKPSMNLIFDPQLQDNPAGMDSEFHRVILHEFGHCLGLIHEHSRPDRPIRWDEPQVIAYYQWRARWKEEMIREQILKPWSYGPVSGTGFDPRSIMMYEYPRLPDGRYLAYYTDGSPFATPANTALTALDKVLISRLYPKPAPGLDVIPLAVGGAAADGSIAAAGQVAAFRFTTADAGHYVIELGGSTPLILALSSDLDDRKALMNAVESPAGAGAPAPLTAPLAANTLYYVEVRHQQVLTGTGDFQISVSVHR